ncbi:MAG: SRPBCC domain-containing protein [Proteobacteria bacterium]|nr:SRPBCC domain-containing protein [Pseudomonadota bacterium]
MKADARFDFLVDKEKNTITIKREFAAKRQLVWDCYTKRELLDRWFAPKPLTTKTRFMDFSEGGHWHYAMVEPNGQEYWGRMDYQTIRPIDNYTSLDGFCDETGALNPALPRSKWNVTFSDAATHTLVETVVSYASAEALQQVMQMGMKEGLTSTLERLDELLSSLG